MAAEIEMMFSVQKTPWHGLGHVVKEAPTSREAIRLAGLDWKVKMVPIYTRNPTIGGFSTDEVSNIRAAQRSSDGRILGVMTDAYTPLQNSEAFSFFDPFIDASEATYETAGSLRDGERVWILAKLKRDPSIIVPGDEVEKFILLSNGHDGIMSVRLGFTPIRVVCANTLRLAHDNQASRLVRIRHTANVSANVTELREIMNVANASFEASAEQYRSLAKRDINQADLEEYVTRVFQLSKKEAADESEKDAEPTESKSRVVKKVVELFETGKGHDIVGVKGTMWGAYNAVTEYLSYERGTDQNTRINNLWFGQSQRINQRALDVAVEYAQAA